MPDYRPHILASLLMLAFLLGACGIKPETLSPPDGAEKTTFPKTYPDLDTDPEPTTKY